MSPSPEQAAFPEAFAAALREPRSAIPARLAARPGVDPAVRFAIYRNNMAAGLGRVLADRFPVLRRLLGADFFAALTDAFIRQHPPAGPVLLEYGALFPNFVERFPPSQHLAYLADVARLEWLRHCALLAADAAPIDRAALAAQPPDVMARLRFTLHPSLAILRSPFPIVSIWRANIDPANPAVVPAGLPGENALLVRPGLVAEIHAVPASRADFVERLQAGVALGDATNLVGADLTAALAFLLSAGILTGFFPVSDDAARRSDPA
ncbi:putative DNA-binding protein [Dongia mobilis]|uniref:Putative DNA-binding protein n=1 Tax=Dongia mobilis TaxID=578943 RepID=A0A4R6WUI4_9PROT|nr:DNA-binding domain-containing protein [Dongia mobilis]TDQ80598.1 putative DNA-binding protein [Dongia mobilis]